MVTRFTAGLALLLLAFALLLAGMGTGNMAAPPPRMTPQGPRRPSTTTWTTTA